MSKIRYFVLTLIASCLAASAQTEVLYVNAVIGSNASIATYNVDPNTAAATKTGPSVAASAGTLDPLLLNGKLVVYLWNSTDVWLYQTSSTGALAAQPSQHLTFDFPYPVNTFVADPNGKFAYACLVWTDSQQNSRADIVLFTIDPSTGMLTNTARVAGAYKNDYVGAISFSFGVSGRRLYMKDFNNAPYTCNPGYDYFSVDKNKGVLGPATTLVQVGADCAGSASAAVSDALAGGVSTCCGPGSGGVFVTATPTGQTINCSPSMLEFCGDDGTLAFDPAGRNLFFTDADLNQVSIAQPDFANSTLVATSSLIPGNPALYFSPDSKLVYAVQPGAIDIYPFRATAGALGPNNPLEGPIGETLATATLP